MTIRYLIALGVAVIAAAILACVALTAYWQRTQPPLKDPSKLVSAVQAFSRDRTARGQPLPTAVSLRELISGGYIAASDVRAFDGMEVTIALPADETFPQEILIHVRLPDGSQIGAMADGSIQQLPKSFNRTNRADLRH